MCPNSVTLLYRGSDDDLKQLVTRASSDLATKVFRNIINNRLLLLKFTSSEFFSEHEAEDLSRSIENSLLFAEKFCARLKERYELLPALNKLLNLDDQDLSNYQRIIRRIFIPLLQEKVVRGGENQAEESKQLLNVPRIIVGLDNQFTEKDSLITIGSITGLKNPKKPASYLRTSCLITGTIMVVVGAIFICIYIASGLTDAIYGHLTHPNRSNKETSNTLNNSNLLTPIIYNFTTNHSTTETPHTTRTSTVAPKFLTIIATLANKNHYGTSTPPAPNGITIPEKPKQHTIFANKPSDLNVRIQEICDPNAATTVILHIDDHFDWYGLRVDCATRVYGLRIESYASIKNINEILNQTSNIHMLAINCDKIGIRNKHLLDNLPKVELKKLKTLEIVSQNGASDCSPVFFYLAGHVKYLKLKSLNISNVAITDENKPEIQRIFSRMSASTPVKILINDITMQTILDIKTRSMTFLQFHFCVRNISSQFALPTLTDFLTNANYTKEFSSNIPIPDELMKTVFVDLMRLRLQTLVFAVKVRKERKVFRFAFTRNLRSLESFELELRDWESKSHINPYLLLTDFKLLPDSLKEFRVVTNFNAKAQGAFDVHCRGYNKTTNAQGGIGIMLDRCVDCDDVKGCITRRR